MRFENKYIPHNYLVLKACPNPILCFLIFVIVRSFYALKCVSKRRRRSSILLGEESREL